MTEFFGTRARGEDRMIWTNWIAIGCVLGAASVGLGAFGSHGLSHYSERQLEIFEIAARYMMYHALALLAVGCVASRIDSTWIQGAGWSFVVGTLVFSGTLLALVFSGVKVLGAITPLGGVALIAGWLCLAIGVVTVAAG